MNNEEEPFRYGPEFVGHADCCGKPQGCTNLSPTCLFRNSPLKYPELADPAPGEEPARSPA